MLLSAVVFCSLSSLALSLQCNIPPELWCTNLETATRCKVYDQCKEFLTVKPNAEKVNITLYHESLCPDCINFITGSLWTAFEKVSDIFTITLVPFGNAMERKDPVKKDYYKFECQHGEQECIGNIIDSCVIYQLQNERASFNFTHCVSSDLKEHRGNDIEKAAKRCAKEQNIDFDKVQTCANGLLGNQLEHQMALRTGELNPPHKYVPWVTVNGVHTEELEQKVEEDLVRVVCDMYQGPKPSACQELHQRTPTRSCLRN